MFFSPSVRRVHTSTGCLPRLASWLWPGKTIPEDNESRVLDVAVEGEGSAPLPSARRPRLHAARLDTRFVAVCIHIPPRLSASVFCVAATPRVRVATCTHTYMAVHALGGPTRARRECWCFRRTGAPNSEGNECKCGNCSVRARRPSGIRREKCFPVMADPEDLSYEPCGSPLESADYVCTLQCGQPSVLVRIRPRLASSAGSMGLLGTWRRSSQSVGLRCGAGLPASSSLSLVHVTRSDGDDDDHHRSNSAPPPQPPSPAPCSTVFSADTPQIPRR